MPIICPFWANGPPESPEHAEIPPVKGPVQTLVDAKGSEEPKREASALAHTSQSRRGRFAFWRVLGMFGIIEVETDPQPDNIELPVGTSPAAGRSMGWTDSLHDKDDDNLNRAISLGLTPLENKEKESYIRN